MAAPAPILRGPLATHGAAPRFAAEVHRVHRRYAAEVVAANHLCPFLRDVDTGFGAFVAMLDPGEPDLEAVIAAVREAGNPVIHVVFPLIRPPLVELRALRRAVGPGSQEGAPRSPGDGHFPPRSRG